MKRELESLFKTPGRSADQPLDAAFIAGYNAGEGAVGRWLKEWKGQDLDLFVESIPYDQTRGYTKRVLSSFATYPFLYGDPPRTIPRFAMVLPR